MRRTRRWLGTALVLALVPGVCCTPVAARSGKGAFAADLLTEVPRKLPLKQISKTGHDTELTKVRIELGLDAQQRLTRHEVRERKVLTDYAVDHYGDPRLVHDADRQTLTVTEAASVMVDGTRVVTQHNGINETTPFELAKAPAYTRVRETVVTHVGLERGGATALDATVQDTAARPFPLHLEIPVADAGPTRELVVQVTRPGGVPLKHDCVGCTAEVSEGTADGRKVVTFTLRDVPPFHDEARHRSGQALAPGQPRLVLAGSADWAAVARELAELTKLAAATATQVTAKAAELTADLPTPAQRVDALVAFVADAVAAVHYRQDLLGWTPGTADAVLAQGYGGALDRAVLLVALLKAIGVDAWPVLVSRERRIADAVPSLAQFSEVWVRTRVAGEERWLATAGHRDGDPRAWLGGRFALDLRGGTLRPISTLPADRNITHLEAELTLSATREVTGTASLTLTGTANQYRALRAKKQGPEALAKRCAGHLVSGAKASTTTPTHFAMGRTEVALELEAGPLDWESERYLRLPLPDGPGFLADGVDELLRESRTTPLVLPSALLQHAKVTWHLPAEFTVRALPAAVTRKNEVGAFRLTVEREDGAITVTRELVVNDGWITPAQYPALRELLGAARAPTGRSLVLSRELP